tara:strand:+ start:7676 stop:9259 length:1584 start_codon:yes stop_codon:yes gene_type:complete
MDVGTLKSYYAACEQRRDPFLRRARDAADLTIPYLVPPDGNSPATEYHTPHQGIGARGVNNLSSKLLLALLPPNSPFFRLIIDKFEFEKESGGAAEEGLQTELEKALAEMERAVQSEVETSAIRVGVFEALKQLIVAGNVLLYVPDKGGLRIFNLDRFTCKRDPMGNVQSIIVKESIDPDVLPANVRMRLEEEGDAQVSNTHGQKSVDVYTGIYRDKGKWMVRQEVADINIPEAEGSYPLDRNPWMPLRYTRIENEDYGRGFIEEYMGDLQSLEGLTQAIVQGSAAAAKVLFLCNPNGTTRPRILANSPNGAIVQGNAQDVTCLQMEKFADFRVAQETIAQIKERLGFAFLMNTSIQRQGERVTAEEIRYMAQELEDVLGGVYSILSQEFQLPLVNRLMDRMEKAGRLPKLPKKIVKPTIVTGLEALGRGHDLNKLDSFISGASQLLGDQFATYVNMSDYLKRRATSLGIDVEGLVRTEEEIAMEQQQMAQQAMAQQVAPNVANAAGKMAQEDPEKLQAMAAAAAQM